MQGEIKDGKTVPFGVKIAIWSSCAVLYVTQISGVFYRRRLEIRQDKNDGADPEYQKYVATVPILLPFIPLYSVKKPYTYLVCNRYIVGIKG